MREYINLRTNIAFGLVFAFLVNALGPICSIAYSAEGDFLLPEPGVMVSLSPAFDSPLLKGIKVHPDNPFHFDFILDQGNLSSSVIASAAKVLIPDTRSSSQSFIKQESAKLIKYFLTSLTIPEKDLWVNLSPYEKDRIIPQGFGLTEMGRDLLAEDYMLKQITASLIYPEGRIGQKFWKRVYEEAAKKFGTTNIPVNTFNKVWIVPEKAVVYENAKAGTAYIVESKLKVMLEQDYLALEKHGFVRNDVASVGANIVREIVIPELTKEVNEDKNFAQLRQVYNSLILATWYKNKIKDSILSQVYVAQNKVAGVNIDDPREKQKIYERYLQAFKKGVYNYIKEEQDPVTQQIVPRKYFSGGFGFENVSKAMSVSTDSAMLSRRPIIQGLLMLGVSLAGVRAKAQVGVFGALAPVKSNDPFEQTRNRIDILIQEGFFGANEEEIINQFARLFELDALKALTVFRLHFGNMESPTVSTDLTYASGTRLSKALDASYTLIDRNNVRVASRILKASNGLESRLITLIRQYFGLKKVDQVNLAYFLNRNTTAPIEHELLVQLKNAPVEKPASAFDVVLPSNLNSSKNLLNTVLFSLPAHEQNRGEVEGYLKVVSRNILVDIRQKFNVVSEEEFDRIVGKIEKLKYVDTLGKNIAANSNFEINVRQTNWHDLQHDLAHEIGHNILFLKGFDPMTPNGQKLHELFAEAVGDIFITDDGGLSTDTDWLNVDEADNYHAWSILQLRAIKDVLIVRRGSPGEYWTPSSMAVLLPGVLNDIAANKEPETVVRGIFESLRIAKERVIPHLMPGRGMQLWMTRETEASFNAHYKNQAMIAAEINKSLSRRNLLKYAGKGYLASLFAGVAAAITPQDLAVIDVQNQNLGVRTAGDLNGLMEGQLNKLVAAYAQTDQNILAVNFPLLMQLVNIDLLKRQPQPYTWLGQIVRREFESLAQKKLQNRLTVPELMRWAELQSEVVGFIQRFLKFNSTYAFSQRSIVRFVLGEGEQRIRKYNCDSISTATMVVAREWGLTVYQVEVKEDFQGHSFPTQNGDLHVNTVFIDALGRLIFWDQGFRYTPHKIIVFDSKNNPVQANVAGMNPARDHISFVSLDDLKELYGLQVKVKKLIAIRARVVPGSTSADTVSAIVQGQELLKEIFNKIGSVKQAVIGKIDMAVSELLFNYSITNIGILNQQELGQREVILNAIIARSKEYKIRFAPLLAVYPYILLEDGKSTIVTPEKRIKDFDVIIDTSEKQIQSMRYYVDMTAAKFGFRFAEATRLSKEKDFNGAEQAFNGIDQDLSKLIDKYAGKVTDKKIQELKASRKQITIELEKLKVANKAMVATPEGGIDLTSNINLETQASNGGIRFHMDPAMLRQLQDAAGLTIDRVTIQPLGSLLKFLGIN